MLESILFPILPFFGSLLLFVGVISCVAWHQERKGKKRRSPLTFKLLRGPGHELVTKLDDINFDISTYLFVIWLFPFVIFSLHISQSYFSDRSESWIRIGINVLAVVIMEAYAIRKLIKLWDKKRLFREGFEAESAVGSELNQLMLDGAHVFHDLPADHFNIDHIVVSPKGVFCVETKSRVKYLASEGKANANVEFDGSALKFPSHIEIAPIEQSRANAKWLKEWLTQATGEEIKVYPVLALPGWFINRTARSDVIVINGKNCRPIFSKLMAHQALSEAQIQRVAFQLENRCRDIEPTRYRKAEKKLVAV